MTIAEVATGPIARSVVGFYQPADWSTRATVADPALPHQIRIVLDRNMHLVVGCNCTLRLGPFTTPLGQFTTLEQAWGLYDAHLAGPA